MIENSYTVSFHKDLSAPNNVYSHHWELALTNDFKFRGKLQSSFYADTQETQSDSSTNRKSINPPFEIASLFALLCIRKCNNMKNNGRDEVKNTCHSVWHDKNFVMKHKKMENEIHKSEKARHCQISPNSSAFRRTENAELHVPTRGHMNINKYS